MNKKLPVITFEGLFFYSCLAVSLLVVIFNSTNPSLDGPSHLYNAKIINYLLNGNEFVGKYYAINKVPVPNITDHYLLALFMNIFSWQVAEKLLVVLYLVSFSLLFRRLIKEWKGTNTSLSIFAIPFSFSLFYYIGFYNFCLSFPLLFGMLIYHRKYFSGKDNKPVLKNYVILCLIATLLYFTNGLAFLFAALAIFLFELVAVTGLSSKKINTDRPFYLKRLLPSLGIWLPGVICFIIFLYKIPISSDFNRIPFLDLIRWIYTIKPLVVYDGSEERFTKPIFCLLGIALFSVIYYKVRKKNLRKFNSSDEFLFLTLISFLLYLFVPNDTTVGMMSHRLCYFVFIFFLIWVALQENYKIVGWIVSAALMCIHFTFLFYIHQPEIADLNGKREMVEEAGKGIKPNSVVLVANVAENWTLGHLADYLGTDKPLIILPNYEPEDEWFATSWNNRTMPRILLDGKDFVPPYLSKYHTFSNETKAVEYIFIYGNYDKIVYSREWKILNDILNRDYKPIYASTDGFIHVFSLPGE